MEGETSLRIEGAVDVYYSGNAAAFMVRINGHEKVHAKLM